MMIQNCSYLNIIYCSKNGLEEKFILNYYTEQAGMDGLPKISIRTVIITAIQSFLSNQNSENYLEGSQIIHGILQVPGKMIKIVFFLH